MEITNELNKFLSYIHMGTNVFRIYYNEANKFDDKVLENLLTEIMEVFKKHEESITRLITLYNEEATSSLTAAGILGIYKEKMKIFDSPFDICLACLKSTNMGTLSALKFLKNNKNLHNNVKEAIHTVINDYGTIENKILKFMLENI